MVNNLPNDEHNNVQTVGSNTANNVRGNDARQFGLDIHDAQSFLDMLDPDNAYYAFQTFDDDSRRRNGSLTRVPQGFLCDVSETLHEMNSYGAGVFVCINALKRNSIRNNANIIKIRALYVDLDDAPLDPVLQWDLKPNIVVQSSPGKYHVYWVLDDCPIDQFTTMQKKLAIKFRGDMKVADLCHVMRLPGTWHHKDKQNPHMVKLLATMHSPTKVHFADFVHALRDIDLPTPRTRNVNAPLDLNPYDRINEAALALIPRWAPYAFPGGMWGSGGSYRVSSRTMLQDWYEESLSIHPTGIREFGSERSLTPIGAIARFCAYDAENPSRLRIVEPDENELRPDTLTDLQAAQWLADALGMDFEKIETHYLQETFPDDIPIRRADIPDPRDKFYPLSEDQVCEMPDHTQCVENLLHDGAVSVLYGPSHVGKSFLALDLAMHIARGLTWHGRRVVQGKCFYITSEGVGGLKSRILAWRKHHDADGSSDFHVIPAMVDMRKIESVQILNRAISKVASSARLIVIDTVLRALGGGDENMSTDMGSLANNAERLGRTTGAHVLLIHHSGKDPTKGFRGHSSLRGNVDTEIVATRPRDDGPVTISTTKQRDGKLGEVLTFDIQPVHLDRTDQWETPITSCVIKDAPKPELPPHDIHADSQRLKDDGNIALNVLRSLGGHATMAAWRQSVYLFLENDGYGNKRTQKQKFERGRTQLLNAEVVMRQGNAVWIKSMPEIAATKPQLS